MEIRGKEWTPQEVWQIIGELSRISAGLAEAFAKKPEKPHYTIPEAMDFLGVTRKTVIAHIRTGVDLKGERHGKHDYLRSTFICVDCRACHRRGQMRLRDYWPAAALILLLAAVEFSKEIGRLFT